MSHTNIRISEKLRDHLKDLGKMGESYEDVIWRIMAKKYQPKEPKDPVEYVGEVDEKLSDIVDGIDEEYLPKPKTANRGNGK